MSDLKDLTAVVQDAVRAPAFPILTYRARRRRKRRAALVVATAAVLTLAIGIPVSRYEHIPVAAQSTYQPGDGVSYSKGSDPKGQEFLGRGAELVAAAAIDQNRWMSVWSRCSPACRYGAVVKWDGVKVAMPVRSKPYDVVRRGDELVLVAGPARGTSDDATWSDSFLVRFTERGPVRTALRYQRPSSTFSTINEVLAESGMPNSIDVVNVEKSTLRRLRVPGSRFPTAPVRDDNGRWWILDDIGGTRVLWTDDGKNWQRTMLDSSMGPGLLAASRNGRTILAGSEIPTMSGDGRVGTLKISTDAGVTWRTITTPQTLQASSPVAFDDGTAYLIGYEPGQPEIQHVYRVGDQGLEAVPDDKLWLASVSNAPLFDLRGDESLLSLIVWDQGDPSQDEPRAPWSLTLSTDRGKTWTSFVPR